VVAQIRLVKPDAMCLCERRANVRACPRVTARDSRLQFRHKKAPFAGAFVKPSDGLEPSTPSLPWKFGGGTGVHDRVFTGTFVLQVWPSECVGDVRACPRVLNLMYPSRTRGALSV
jgi:hypothetical protein